MIFLLCTILHIGSTQLDVEIADTVALRNKGLMHRESLGANEGMLFIYNQPNILSFWMKNTYIPLTIGFFNADKVLIQIEDMDIPTSAELTLYQSKKQAQYALEVNRNWFTDNKISIGDKFTLELQ